MTRSPWAWRSSVGWVPHLQRILDLSDAKGHEPEASHIRCTYAMSCLPWSQPLEESIRDARKAHLGLVRGGELQFAGHSYYVTLSALVDCCGAVDELEAEAESAMTFSARIGNEQAVATYAAYRQFVRRAQCSGRR